MMLRFSLRFLIVITFLYLSINNLPAKTLDHKSFLHEMENSSDQVYSQCLLKYDDYLKEFPNDVSVFIEKCKFIQFAQYDDYEDYNPNQAEFDSCVKNLTENFPNNPEVLIFQTSYLWGDELKNVFTVAEKSVKDSPEKWSNENLAIMYLKISDNYYWEEEYQLAYSYIKKAINKDKKYKSSLEHARILIEMNNKEKALDVLLSIVDTSKITWQLSQKADLLLQLEAYSEALELYKLIDEIDSTFNNNLELANTLEGVGKYDFARSYLIADTSQHWDKETALRNLLTHDIKYQDGEMCILTYNQYRDLGYLMDPIGIYRLKIFFLHPFQPLKFRDIISLLAFLLILALLLIVPSIWILPVYFIGHHFKLKDKNKSFTTLWGLKAFWLVSAGYLIASFFTIFVDPEIIYSHFNSSFYTPELSQSQLGLMAIVFISIFSIFGFTSLYKKNFFILLSSLWTIRKSILVGIGILLIYRILIGIYIKIGVYSFDISIDEIANIPNILLSSKQEIEAIITSYGKLIGFLIICLIVPIYEEIIFRGVIFDACQRYISFNSANVIQALLFATIHLNLFLFPVFFLFGFITGILRRKSGGLLPGIVFHIINNTLAISILLLR
jgi:membrane protease YdiL (CAAX protease family)/tetratricopeptide (TPR) repeat protein